MKQFIMVSSVVLGALLLLGSTGAAPLPPGPDSRGTARVEREDRGLGWATVLVFGSTGAPDWGGPGSVVYGAWQPGDAAVIFYPPPLGCLARSCFTATVAVRAPDPVPGHRLTLLRLPPGLPGTAGAPVTLVPRRDGSWAWVNP